MRKIKTILMFLVLCLMPRFQVSANEVEAFSYGQNDNRIAVEKEVFAVGEEISLVADENINREGLLYKFVWYKNNWSEWGVVQPLSEINTATFIPESAGNYTFIVDIKDESGKMISKSISVRISTEVWSYNGIVTSLQSPQEKYSGPVLIEALTEGETANLQYKFVWMKNDWKEWGVLQPLSENSKIEWTPQGVGSYTLFVDVKDKDGFVQTKSVSYEVVPVQWDIGDIVITPEMEQKKGDKIKIDVGIDGNSTGLQYKFVWMKDDWKEWGVIRGLGDDPCVEWDTPKKAGNYTIYIDVKDRDKKMKTVSKEYKLVSQCWSLDGININEGIPEQIYRNIPVSANVSGDIEGLTYKYVWMKDDWKEWGVIREFGAEPQAIWYPKKAGVYKIYTDVKDKDGKVKTIIQEYEVTEPSWELQEIQAEAEGVYYVGTSTTVTAVTTGETEGLQYKFVQRNGSDWSDWKVLQPFSTSNTVEVNIEKEGDCTIYVDIKDSTGATILTETRVLKGCNFLSLKASAANILYGNTAKFTPVFNVTPKGAEYKYVWMKDNWAEWGVISEFSNEASLEWQPEEPGEYTIITDVKLNGVTKNRSVTVSFRGYVRSANLYPIKSRIDLPSGGYNVSTANIGLKVIEINKKLLGSTNASYTSETKQAVINFQKRNGLSATGVVDLKTWKAMGLSEDAWYNLGTYCTPMKVTAATVKEGYINAMLETAKEYADAKTQYRIGCSGVPGTYADCSGLIYQCLYSVGINSDLNIVDHALAKYEYCSYYMAADTKLGPEVARKDIKKGDLVFYCKFGGGSVCHIAIYAGDGMIYDAWPGIGVTKRSIDFSGYSVCKIRRVIV